MANRKITLSGSGKEILDILCDRLEVDRPQGLKIALAKGISESKREIIVDNTVSKPKWTVPDNVIRDKEYLLFKHLIINEIQVSLTDDEVNQYILTYIENGLRIILNEINELSSMEDYRIRVLS